jgi:magnesium transporter
MHEKIAAKAQLLLDEKQYYKLRQLLLSQQADVAAELIEGLGTGKKRAFGSLPPEFQAEVALAFGEHAKHHVVARCQPAVIARFVQFLDDNDATDILQFLPDELRARVLQRLKPTKSRRLEKLLAYGSETAGGLMDLYFIVIPHDALLKEAVAAMKAYVREYNRSPVILVSGAESGILGRIPYRSLLFPPQSKAADLAQPLPFVSHDMDREQLLDLVFRKRSDMACVMDADGSLIGIVHLHDLVKVAEEEATEDVYRFAGVDTEEDARDPVLLKVRRRYKWLIINLGTAFLASMVVALFEDSIAKIAILAVYMPMVAGEGGNAATQALAVAVRGLAVGDLDWPQARRIIMKEAAAGMINGVIVGIVAGGVAILLGGSPMLGFVLGIAMVINLFVAGFFGALVPFVLKRLNIDPAVASTVFVTTATDIFGFLAFLGLGTLLLI